MKITVCARTEEELKKMIERLHDENYEFRTTGAWYDFLSSKWYQTLENLR